MKDLSLIDILNSILMDNGFMHLQEVDECLHDIYQNFRFYGPNKGTHPQYLLILDIDLKELASVSEFLEMQSVLFQRLVEAIRRPAFDKNVSLLILISKSAGEVLQQNLDDFILQVEEDPYYFKKLVLVYDPESAKKLTEHYKSSSQNTYQYFYDHINAQNSFEAFVEGNDPIYQLIAQLYIKLPFIPIPLEDQESPTILSEVLRAKIDSEDLLLLWDKVCLSDASDINSLSLKADEEALDSILIVWDITEVGE